MAVCGAYSPIDRYYFIEYLTTCGGKVVHADPKARYFRPEGNGYVYRWQGKHFSDVDRLVTCPECLKHNVFKELTSQNLRSLSKEQHIQKLESMTKKGCFDIKLQPSQRNAVALWIAYAPAKTVLDMWSLLCNRQPASIVNAIHGITFSNGRKMVAEKLVSAIRGD